MAIHREAAKRGARMSAADGVAQGDSEQEMERWMDDLGLPNGWQLAPVLVRLGYDTDELRRLGEDLSTPQLSAVIEWLGYSHEIGGLLSDIDLGTARIAAIVHGLKTYTYVDRGTVHPVDVNEGLDNTLVIFQHELKSGITVTREFAGDLPAVQAYGSELNQVWTNLIDNAVDAMAGRGTLVLRTRSEDGWVVVEIEDSGPGIPEEIRDKIFDPFFTTKAPGEGTGLGLNLSHNIIVRKHEGRMEVESEPGRTRFTVHLPIDGPVDRAGDA